MADDRSAAVRLLWAAVRKLPHGEEAMRAAVASINDRDGTNQDVAGTEEYSSTKRLSVIQLIDLAHDFRRRAKLPTPSWKPRGPRGGRARRPESSSDRPVTYFASQGERDYVYYLFEQLTWPAETRDAFIERQTKGVGLRTHAACEAVVAPLERMLRARGFVCTTHGRNKHWRAPARSESPR